MWVLCQEENGESELLGVRNEKSIEALNMYHGRYCVKSIDFIISAVWNEEFKAFYCEKLLHPKVIRSTGHNTLPKRKQNYDGVQINLI